MACPEFEDLLNEGSGGHAMHCEKCRALLKAFDHIDATFETAFTKISAPPELAAAVRTRVAREFPGRKPSLLPEFLDLIGWAAVLAIAAIVGPRFANLLSSIIAGLN